MSDLRTTLGADRIELRLDDGTFPRDAVYAAAFSFIDRCYVRLDRVDGGTGIVLRAKTAGAFDGEATAAELRGELAAQAFRVRLAEEGRKVTEAIENAAFGAPASAEAALAADLADLSAAPFDDPLGIAMSWEEKHKSAASTDASTSGPTPGSGPTPNPPPQTPGEGEHAS